jgi:hypothetical protein
MKNLKKEIVSNDLAFRANDLETVMAKICTKTGWIIEFHTGEIYIP